MAEGRLLPTAQGDARVYVHAADRPHLTLVLQPGASGKLDAADLQTLAAHLPGQGVTVVLLEPPFAVAGKRLAPRPVALDEALAEVVPQLAIGTPLVVGGRSAGARSSCRSALAVGAVGCLCLAFPLHPPGKPEKSRQAELLGAGVPTLVVQGERDAFGGPGEFPPLPATTELVAVPGATHSLARPEAVLLAVTSWLPGINT
ncbi:hydrolase [Nocardioides mangrovicus]|uniref:Hydrolase n=1 Tax=Nocardioides mangrovicus TaxID=2478913 RepID=A0A3L8P7Q9_9ACTN|nr:alpha/beta family hydrolase [Nocardioides mangrovicus]RLV50997.1 hydrolase [Nocardioides mangrovicus]